MDGLMRRRAEAKSQHAEGVRRKLRAEAKREEAKRRRKMKTKNQIR